MDNIARWKVYSEKLFIFHDSIVSNIDCKYLLKTLINYQTLKKHTERCYRNIHRKYMIISLISKDLQYNIILSLHAHCNTSTILLKYSFMYLNFHTFIHNNKIQSCYYRIGSAKLEKIIHDLKLNELNGSFFSKLLKK